MEKTVKIRSFEGKEIPQEEKAENQKSAAGIVIKNPQLEEERAKSLEYLKKIEQLEKSLKEEQAKSAALADTLKKICNIAFDATQLKD
jgi:hypothetical protein